VEKFFRTGSKAGIQPKHAGKLRLQLFALDNAKHPGDVKLRVLLNVGCPTAGGLQFPPQLGADAFL
jgi:hypothetical protein